MKLTKTYRITRCREIIDKNQYFVDFPEHDFQEFIAMAGWDDCGILAIQRRLNPKYPSDTRHLYVCINGDWDSKSWTKSINPPAQYAEEKQVMRAAIVSDTQEYLEECGIECCEHCESEDNLQVDHSDPAFDTIAKAYFEAFGVPKIADSPLRVGYVFAEQSTEASWIAFHTAHANYQILCRSCNASKGKGKAVKREILK